MKKESTLLETPVQLTENLSQFWFGWEGKVREELVLSVLGVVYL